MPFPPHPRVGLAMRETYILYIEAGISLSMPYRQIAKHASKFFGVNVTTNMVRLRAQSIKARQRYEQT